jgi:predicted  nucleic acid-binding Zn-ribbon protein
MPENKTQQIETEIEDQRNQIEIIETHINLKDASVASDCEINQLLNAQQVHRDHIHDLKKALDESYYEPEPPRD